MLRKSKFKTFLWYSSVGLLVTIAVAVSLFRIYFSSVAEYREQLQSLAGEYLGQPVTIGRMDARVVGLSPAVILHDVALLHTDGEQLLTRFNSIHITLSPVDSILRLSPVIELSLNGANLEITRNSDGSFGVQGLELAKRDGEQKPRSKEAEQALGNWLLSQSRLALRDSNITLHDGNSGERFSFEGVEAELQNDGERHRLNGFVHLPKSIGRELRVAVDIEGNPFQLKGWRGGIYVKTVQLHPRQWLQQLTWRDSSIRDGILDLELWGSWSEGRLESVTTRLKALGLTLARGNDQQTFPQLSADARLLRLEDGWQLDVSGLQLQHDDTPALPMHLTLRRENDKSVLQADKLQLEPLAALLAYLPHLGQRQQAMLREMAPAGSVEQLYISRSGSGEINAQAQLRGLALRPWEKLPGVKGLSAQFALFDGNGKLQLHGEEGELLLPRLFRDPLQLDRLAGTLYLQQESAGWRLFSEPIELVNSDLSARLGLELLLQEGSAPWLSLQGRFSANDARAVPRYLPAGIMKEKSLQWLDNAFKGGRVPVGSVQYHGYTSDFPFLQQQGRFEVLFDAEAVELHYQDGWPNLHQLAGKVHFDGPGMRIDAKEARIFNARVGATTVSIDNFMAAQLRVNGQVRFQLSDGLRFLRESPLSKNTGQVLDLMQGEGGASLALQLAIPLSQEVSESLPLAVSGTVDFAGNRLEVYDGITLHQLGGELHFTERSFTADQLRAELFGKPATIVVVTDGGEQPRVVVAVRGSAEMEALREALQLPILDYLEGEAAWQGSLSLPRGTASEGVELHLSSNLVGVASTLPSPLAKGGESARDMYLSFYLSGARSGEVRLTLAELFGVAWQQSGTEEGRRVRRAKLRFGGDAPLNLPKSDVIEVVGVGRELDVASWRGVMKKLGGEGSATAQVPPLPVEVSMQRLHLVSHDGGQGQAEPLQALSVPMVSFMVKQFAYDDFELGTVSFKMVPRDKQLVFRELSASSELLVLTGDGSWSEGGGTLFNLKLYSPDLGKMMTHLGFATVIKGGETNVSGKLWWRGDPAAVSLEGLNGQLALNIKGGTIIDVEPGAGRMLGILSLPALPRRLFLDFSDVFKEGLSFESIEGDIRIELGHAFTSNLRMESAPANILITGRTGLVSQDFDQDLYVAPNVSGTATVASALAWGPQVAAVVALLQEVFKSNIEAATMTHYHISGQWQDPVIRHIKEHGEQEEEPFFLE